MTLYCMHKTYKLPSFPIDRVDGKDVMSPQVVVCKRCNESWYESEPEPRVAIGTMEGKV